MSDPWGSFQNFMNAFKQMAVNPTQYIMQNFGISQDIANNPNAIIQKLMSEGKLSQEQYNNAMRTAQQIQNNPLFRQFMK